MASMEWNQNVGIDGIDIHKVHKGVAARIEYERQTQF